MLLTKRIVMIWFSVLLALGLMAFAGQAVWSVPHIVSYQGRLTDNDGIPLADDTHMVWFRIFLQKEGGEPIWDEEIAVVTIDGLFTAILGATDPLLPSMFADENEYWLSASIDGNEILPRVRFVSVPFALVSGQISTLSEQNVLQFWLLVQTMTDADGDGYEKLSVGGSDCNDLDYDVHPGAAESPGGATCSDGKDNDCDGAIDEADPDCSGNIDANEGG